MKSCNQKCIKICSSMKVSLLYLCIDYHSLSLTDDVYSLFTYITVCSPTRSSVSHIYYTIALILIIIIFIISICSQTHKCYYNAKHFHLFSFHVNLRVYKCACVIKFHLGKWRPIPDQIFVVVETVFFHSI